VYDFLGIQRRLHEFISMLRALNKSMDSANMEDMQQFRPIGVSMGMIFNLCAFIEMRMCINFDVSAMEERCTFNVENAS
jgi:hypothetical protein